MTNEAKPLPDLRKSRGLSPERLAELTGVGSQHVYGVEAGKHNVTPAFLKKLELALKIPAAEIAVKKLSPKFKTGEFGTVVAFSGGYFAVQDAAEPSGTNLAQEKSGLELKDAPITERRMVGQQMYQNQTQRIFNELDWLAGWLTDEALKKARDAIADGRIPDEPEKGRLEAALLRESIRRAKSKAANHGN